MTETTYQPSNNPFKPFKPSDDYDLDLGGDHYLQWMFRDGNRVGALIEHPACGSDQQLAGSYCAGSVYWSVQAWHVEKGVSPLWDLAGEVDDQLTLSPSVLCSCGDHGYIRQGRWVVV